VTWTLGNAQPLWIHELGFTAGAGWHHSNWLHVPEDTYDGPDGFWSCEERDFDPIAAAVVGGVLFAQSTQAGAETQAFPKGAAMRLPPHARVVGQLHALNASEEDLSSTLEMTLHTLAESEVKTRLLGLSIDYRSLELPPKTRSRFTTTCDIAARHQKVVGRPLDMKLYYFLPHYHALGLGMSVDAIGKDGQARRVVSSDADVGDPSGTIIDPPFDLQGVDRLRVSCEFDNPRNDVVRYGLGDQEMCVLLAFTDSEVMWGGGDLSAGNNQVVGVDEAGVTDNTAPCSLIAVAPTE
jgi:hypothetical protein